MTERAGAAHTASDLRGFRHGTMSVHTSRTMMLQELRLLLDSVDAEAPASGYVAAMMDDNVLGKPTRSTRQRSATPSHRAVRPRSSLHSLPDGATARGLAKLLSNITDLLTELSHPSPASGRPACYRR